MESSGKKSVLTGKLLLALLLALTGWAAYTQLCLSEAARALAAKEDQTLYVAVLTQPAMTAAYNPRTRKAVFTTVKRRKTPKQAAENAADLFRAAGVHPAQTRYYIPLQTKRDAYWEQFKHRLAHWRYNPLLTLRVLWDYAQAYHDKRTNLNPAEFLLYALEGTRLEITDFTVRNTGQESKKKRASAKTSALPDAVPAPVQDRAPLAVADRPLIVEILNGSGKKGAALELTQYLRNQTQKGLLQVDVLQYDNYPGEKQKHTRVIDYTGRLAQLKQLSTAIGVNSEIVSEKQDAAICDARIVIGEDFKQPF